MDAFIGDWLTELTDDDILSKWFIKAYLDTKSGEATPSIGRSMSINS